MVVGYRDEVIVETEPSPAGYSISDTYFVGPFCAAADAFGGVISGLHALRLSNGDVACEESLRSRKMELMVLDSCNIQACGNFSAER